VYESTRMRANVACVLTSRTSGLESMLRFGLRGLAVKCKSLSCLLLMFLPLAQAEDIPAEFVRDRIFVVVNGPDGKPVRFFTDTGGGWNAISEGTQRRLKLPHSGNTQLDAERAALVDASELFRRSNVPAPVRNEAWLHGMLVVAPAEEDMEGDGTLGSRWFAGHIWDIDYGRHTLRVLQKAPASSHFRALAMGFRTSNKGARDLNFPRVTITVDGQDIDVLLDTGASARLLPAAATQLGAEPGSYIGTSFVIRSIFEAWKAAHPDWRTLADADAAGSRQHPMIEVPRVRIGDVEIGPVWFTQRPDSNFLEFMSNETDRTVSGALGGSALRYLHLVLDYPAAKMYLRKLDGAPE